MSRPDLRHRIPRLSQSELNTGRETFKPLNRATRLKNLESMIKREQVDAVLVSWPANIDYFSGFKPIVPEDREAFILIQPDGRRDFVTRQLYFGQTPEGFTPVDLLTGLDSYAKQLKTSGINIVGIEKDNLTVAEHEQLLSAGLETKGVDPKEQRQYKTEAEIDRIREACRLGDNTFTYILSKINEGISEVELRDILETHMKSQGVSEPAFSTIVAFGKNAADPHHMPDETTLTPGNFIVFDFGFTGQDGYKSDMTRTVFFGTPTEEQERMYETVRVAQQAVTDYLQDAFRENPEEKLIAKDIDKIARDIILSAGYAPELFSHGLGHGIGLQTHEEPFLNKKSEHEISAGMVFSNEPGIYIAGDQGVRIEDLIAIHPDGKVEMLMNSPKNLITIPA